MQKNKINPFLGNIGEDVMGFLNEIQLNYPDAISLASGRPNENYFDISNFTDYFNLYLNSTASSKRTRKKILNDLGQYSRTKGIINELISKYLEKDKNINVTPENLLVTVGTQEAIAISIITLCDRLNDVIVIEDPTYIGITHFSIISGYQIDSVTMDADGISLKNLEEKINFYKRNGKKVKLVYVIPDFQNPTGNTMSIEKRHRLLEMADKHDFIILEDNAYGDYKFKGKENTTLKSLDKNRKVIYLHSFSKIIYPSLRLAAMVVDQIVLNDGELLPLSDLMAKTKGYLTVNTSSISQAILGGILIKNDFSLKNSIRQKVIGLRKRKDRMIFSLNAILRDKDASWANEISWNSPDGGFFLTIRLPFDVDKNEAVFCAENYKVIFTPMSFFYNGNGGKNEIRIAYSNIKIAQIYPAIYQLSRYFKTKLMQN